MSPHHRDDLLPGSQPAAGRGEPDGAHGGPRGRHGPAFFPWKESRSAVVNMRTLRFHFQLAPVFRLLRSAGPQGVTRCRRPAVWWPGTGPDAQETPKAVRGLLQFSPATKLVGVRKV
jgi:hypothetical protein